MTIPVPEFFYVPGPKMLLILSIHPVTYETLTVCFMGPSGVLTIAQIQTIQNKINTSSQIVPLSSMAVTTTLSLNIRLEAYVIFGSRHYNAKK